MIINIRGTSGSGKSTLVRNIMKRYPMRMSVKEVDRKRPIGYQLLRPNGRTLGVLGHYDTDCGGCDTIPKMERIFSLANYGYVIGLDVIFEGLLISADVNRTVELAKTVGFDELVVVALDLPLEECLAGVNQRRKEAFDRRLAKAQDENIDRLARGLKPKPLPESRGDVNPKNTESKHKGVRQSCARLRAAGVQVEMFDNRDMAFLYLKELLKL